MFGLFKNKAKKDQEMTSDILRGMIKGALEERGERTFGWHKENDGFCRDASLALGRIMVEKI